MKWKQRFAFPFCFMDWDMSFSKALAELLLISHDPEEKQNDITVIVGRLNCPLSVETGYIITEGFSHQITPPERRLCVQSLCGGSYQAINHRQSSTGAATWLLMPVFNLCQNRVGSVRGSLSFFSWSSHQLCLLSLSLSQISYKEAIHTLIYW